MVFAGLQQVSEMACSRACPGSFERYGIAMNPGQADLSGAQALPPARLGIAITGHRVGNAAFDTNLDAIQAALSGICSTIDQVVSRHEHAAPVRLNALFANGSDLLAVDEAFARAWEIVAPLPFGLRLNTAINAHPRTATEARALIAGEASGDPLASAYAARVEALASGATRFELAEQDEQVAALFVATLDNPADDIAARAFSAVASERAAMAGKVMIEQSDLLIAIWDGVTPGAVGGTRHTMAAALNEGVPVLWIDAATPGRVRLLVVPEALQIDALAEPDVAGLIESLVVPDSSDQHARAIRYQTEQWHPHSQRRFHAYRRVETLFGGGGVFRGIVQTYEPPDAFAEGSGKALLDCAGALPGGDTALTGRIRSQILTRFAWADGLSTYLSDAYRGGMVTNFLLSAMAIIAGVAYLPVAGTDFKWPFALLEFVLLLAIVAITVSGRRRGLHGRWFETRRVAEYLRHAPILLLLGVARSAGRWPRGTKTQWPEHYARGALRDLGLPNATVTQGYLRAALSGLLASHVGSQRDYHVAKARRLAQVHHNLDRLSEALFALAVISVASYLLLFAAGASGILPEAIAAHAAKTFTFLGVTFPALGGVFAGIRYFGDFERFAAISEVTAEKLEALGERIALLLNAPQIALNFGQVASLAHTLDDIVIDEIENWQAVFAGKQISIPV